MVRWARRGLRLGIGVVLALGASASAEGLDLDLYGALLQRYTAPVPDLARVRVDYAGLRDEPRWRALVDGLAGVELDRLASRAQHEALWINTYNILAIDLVVRNGPVSSIRDLGSWLRPVWQLPAGVVGGRRVTLHEIEHEILRPLGDPRIHAAIVCASLSCPPLRRRPYRAEALDAQLDEALRRWLADPDKGARLDASRGVLRLSRVLDWFEEDFARDGDIVAAIEPALPDAVRRGLRALGRPPRVRYFDYDWRVNALRGGPRRLSAHETDVPGPP